MGLAADLAALELFGDAPAAELGHLAGLLTEEHFAAGETLLRQGGFDGRFMIVLDGAAGVQREVELDGELRTRHLGEVHTGALLGELSLVRGVPHAATVTALAAVRVATGDHAAFDELLGVGGVAERIATTVALRLADVIKPLTITTRDGQPATLRPLLRADRSQFATSVRGLLPESRRRRFFSAGTPSERMIDYLVNVDYVDHFAWTIGTGRGAARRGLATARYVRSAKAAHEAEVAFGVADDAQGKGLGTLLLGVLGATAAEAGITTFTAEVLSDNIAMRRVFDKAQARWERSEAGVVAATIDVAATRPLIGDELWTRVGAAAHDLVRAAGLSVSS